MARATLTLPARLIKSLRLQDATAPQTPRYAAGKPAVPPEVESRPVDTGQLSDGSTGGNFNQATIPDLQVAQGEDGK